MIGQNHQLSPGPFTDGKQEFYKKGGAPHNEALSRPWVCKVERYNLVLLSIFQYGLMEPEDYPAEWWNA